MEIDDKRQILQPEGESKSHMAHRSQCECDTAMVGEAMESARDRDQTILPWIPLGLRYLWEHEAIKRKRCGGPEDATAVVAHSDLEIDLVGVVVEFAN